MLQEDEDFIPQSMLDSKDTEMNERFRKNQLKFLNCMERIFEKYEKQTDSPVAMDLKNMTVIYDPETTTTKEQTRESNNKYSLFATTSTVPKNAYDPQTTDEYCKKIQAMYFNTDSNDEDEEGDEESDDNADCEATTMEDVTYTNRNVCVKSNIEQDALVRVFQQHRKRLYESIIEDEMTIGTFSFATHKERQPLLDSWQLERGESKPNKKEPAKFKATTQPILSIKHDPLISTSSTNNTQSVFKPVMLFRYIPDNVEKKKQKPKSKVTTKECTPINDNKPSSKKQTPLLEELHLLNAKKAEAFAKSTGRTISDKVLNSPIYLAAWMRSNKCSRVTDVVKLQQNNST
jgi:hypothetical protein